MNYRPKLLLGILGFFGAVIVFELIIDYSLLLAVALLVSIVAGYYVADRRG